MKYIVVDNTEWTYPDLDFASYPTGALELQADTPRNTSVGFQVLLREVPEDAAPAIALEGVDGEVLELVPVYVEGNPGLTTENALPHFPERWGPYWIYDCVRTRGERLHPKDGVAAIEAGEMQATIDVGEYGTGFDIVNAVTDFCINGKEVDKVINRPSKVYDINNIDELDRVIFE